MNYFIHHQYQEYDPSSQNRESYDQSTNNYYSYYSYSNPQFTTGIHPYSYQNPIVQPSQHEEKEPNPPGVTPPPQLPLQPELCPNSYYQYHTHGGAAGVPTVGPQPGAMDAGDPTLVHQPIVRPLYGSVGIMGGIVPGGDAQIHLGPKLNVSSYPFRVNGRGSGRALPMNTAIPFQDQTVIAHGGLHIQGGPSQLPSQSFGETHHGPRPKFSGRTYRIRGRGKGRVQRKHAAAPAQNLQGKSDSLGETSQPMSESGASSSGHKLVPLQGPAQSSSVLPPPKVVSCELCKVECNTLEILQQHTNGKKHKKKLKVFEELQNLNKRVISGQTEHTSTIELKSEVLSQPDRVEVLPCQEISEESKVAGEKRKVEEVEAPEESAKKMRVVPFKRKLRGGKSNRKKMRPCDRSKSLVQPPKPKEVAPLVCELCNVKCESLVVFQSHLVGKKHKSKAKRFLGQETFGASELLQAPRPAMQAVDQNNGNASTSISSQLHEQGFEHADTCRRSLDGGSTLEQNVVSVRQPPN